MSVCSVTEDSASGSLQASHTSLRVIDVSAEAVDAAVAAIEGDRQAFMREPWPPLAEFLQQGGVVTLLDLIQHTPGERSNPTPTPLHAVHGL